MCFCARCFWASGDTLMNMTGFNWCWVSVCKVWIGIELMNNIRGFLLLFYIMFIVQIYARSAESQHTISQCIYHVIHIVTDTHEQVKLWIMLMTILVQRSPLSHISLHKTALGKCYNTVFISKDNFMPISLLHWNIYIYIYIYIYIRGRPELSRNLDKHPSCIHIKLSSITLNQVASY